MKNKGLGLLERQLRMKALMNSMNAAKIAGEREGVEANMENLLTLLKAKAEAGKLGLSKDAILNYAGAAAEKLTDTVQQALPENPANKMLKQFGVKLPAGPAVPNASQLLWEVINKRFAGVTDAPVQDEGVLSGLAGTQAFSANPEIWEKLQTALPDTYTLPNMKTYEVLKNITTSGE